MTNTQPHKREADASNGIQKRKQTHDRKQNITMTETHTKKTQRRINNTCQHRKNKKQNTLANKLSREKTRRTTHNNRRHDTQH